MEHKPVLRKQKKETQKTVILIGGEGHIGKTTLCSKLINDNTGYISFDQMTWEDEIGIESLKKLKKIKNYRYCIPSAYKLIMTDYEKFESYSLQKIESINKDVVLLDSFYFTKDDFYKKFVPSLKKKYRVWDMKKN